MAQPNTTQAPSPGAFFAACNSFHQSAAIKAAIELDLFTGVAEGATTSAALAERCRATQRGVRILCDYLTVLGFLTKTGEQYGLSESSAIFLNQHSPAYMGGAVKFLMRADAVDRMLNLTEIIRNGQPDDSTLTSDASLWVDFARNMAPFAAGCADEIASIIDPGEPCRVLDIAAGHGLFGLAVAQRNQNAHITALDWPHVLDVAWENARQRRVADRFRVIHGSALEVEYGSGYDIVLLTNFLHHFDQPTCESILRKVRAALKPGGCAVTLEFVPDPGRVSPPVDAEFPMIMLTSTPAGDAYTFAELESMFQAAGFTSNESRKLTRSVETLIVSR